MPYCEKCSMKLEEGDSFCPRCGAPIGVGSITYRKSDVRIWSIGRIILLVIGVIILLSSFGLLIGGSGIRLIMRNLSDQESFLLTGWANLEADSYAIVGRGIDIEWTPRIPKWGPRLGDFVTIKIVARSNDPSKEVFIGVAQESYANTYLSDVWYHELQDLSWPSAPWRDVPPEISYAVHPGDSPEVTPLVHSWWVTQVSGSGIQELKWEPAAGNYWIVAMNADGSSGLDFSVRIGARVPMLDTIGNAMLAGGAVALIIGGALIFVGVSRRGLFQTRV